MMLGLVASAMGVPGPAIGLANMAARVKL